MKGMYQDCVRTSSEIRSAPRMALGSFVRAKAAGEGRGGDVRFLGNKDRLSTQG
jgi:hypothetical protein